MQVARNAVWVFCAYIKYCLQFANIVVQKAMLSDQFSYCYSAVAFKYIDVSKCVVVL